MEGTGTRPDAAVDAGFGNRTEENSKCPFIKKVISSCFHRNLLVYPCPDRPEQVVNGCSLGCRPELFRQVFKVIGGRSGRTHRVLDVSGGNLFPFFAAIGFCLWRQSGVDSRTKKVESNEGIINHLI